MNRFFTSTWKLWLLTGFCFFLTVQAYAQQDTKSKLDVETLASANAVHPGTSSWLALKVTIGDSWHVNAHKPDEPSLIGTSVEFDESDFTVEEIRYPEAEVQDFSFTSSPIRIYHGTIYIFTRISVPDNVEPGKHELRATLEAQACDDKTCLMPSEIPVAFGIEVVDRDTPVKSMNQEIFEKVQS